MQDPDDFWREFSFSPEDEDLYNIEVGPYGLAKPRSFGAGWGRLARKYVADPARSMYRMVAKARRGKMPRPQEALDFAMNMVAAPGGEGGLGSSVRWRPLEGNFKFKSSDILRKGAIGKKQLPTEMTGNAWLNRLKQGGVTKSELKYGGVQQLLEEIGPEKISGADLAATIENSSNYPTLGFRRVQLGYPHDIAKIGMSKLRVQQGRAVREFRKAFDKQAEILGLPDWKSGDEAARNLLADPSKAHIAAEYGRARDAVMESDKALPELYNKAEKFHQASHELEMRGGLSHKHRYEQIPLRKYQEILYKWEPPSGEKVNPEGHFGPAYGGTKQLAENVAVFSREGRINTPDLGKLHHVEELQSDWWQAILQEQAEIKRRSAGPSTVLDFDQLSFDDLDPSYLERWNHLIDNVSPNTADELSLYGQAMDFHATDEIPLAFVASEVTPEELTDIGNQLTEVTRQYDQGLITDLEYDDARDVLHSELHTILARGRANLGRDYPQIRRNIPAKEPKIPKFPNWEKYYEMPIKDALARAVESGAEGFTWSTGQSRMNQWSTAAEKMYKTLYDEKIKALIKKETGLEPKLTAINKDVPAGVTNPFTGEHVPADRLEVIGGERFIPLVGNRVAAYREMRQTAPDAYKLRSRVDPDDVIPSHQVTNMLYRMEPEERTAFNAQCREIFEEQADGYISRRTAKNKFFKLYANTYGEMSHYHPEYFIQSYDVAERTGNALSASFGIDLQERAGRNFKSFDEAVDYLNEMATTTHREKVGEAWYIPITDELRRKIAAKQYISKVAQPGGSYAQMAS